MAHILTIIVSRLFTITQKNVFETSFPYHTEVEYLRTLLGMAGHHLPSFPRLECGYFPFQAENESALIVILERLESLVTPRKRTQKVLYPKETDLVFPDNSGEQLAEIAIDITSILLDERVTGYVLVALNRLRRFSVWVKSSYHSKTWKELDTLLGGESAETSSFQDLLAMIASKSSWQVSTIQNWIHLASTSPLSNIEPYVISAIDERNILALACRVGVDQATLDYVKKFYPVEKLTTYTVAFQEFRNLWFEITVPWKGYQLTSEASEWLQMHPHKKSNGKEKTIRPLFTGDALLCFRTSYEEFLDELDGEPSRNYIVF